MNKLSPASQKKLLTCHADLQLLCNSVLQDMPLQICVGERNEADQNAAVAAKLSKLPFPKSKHNRHPSQAVDVMPLDEHGKLDWNNMELVKKMLALFEQHAQKLGIDIRLGTAWGDHDHVELTGPKYGGVDSNG